MEFDELLEHLDDLADLADHGGYIAFAVRLRNFGLAAHFNRALFARRTLPTGAASPDDDVRPGNDPRD